jgi:hypothetical protein
MFPLGAFAVEKLAFNNLISDSVSAHLLPIKLTFSGVQVLINSLCIFHIVDGRRTISFIYQNSCETPFVCIVSPNFAYKPSIYGSFLFQATTCFHILFTTFEIVYPVLVILK